LDHDDDVVALFVAVFIIVVVVLVVVVVVVLSVAALVADLRTSKSLNLLGAVEHYEAMKCIGRGGIFNFVAAFRHFEAWLFSKSPKTSQNET